MEASPELILAVGRWIVERHGPSFDNLVYYLRLFGHHECMASELSEAIAPWVAERSEARAAEWERRREAKAKARAERRAARQAGLVARHARKLARKKPGMLF